MPQFNGNPSEIAAVSGLYIHIPFCRKACHYCDFHFSTSLQGMEAMVDALAKEIEMRGRVWPDPPTTLYFGGGTPSLLNAAQLGRLMVAIRATWGTTAWEEITLEANPEDLAEAALQAWLDLGITRLSVGTQSLQDPTLQWMNRAHSAREAIDGLERAHRLGFKHLSTDLIYGLPAPFDAHWEQDLRETLALPIDHLSAYILTVEPRTVLGNRVKKGEAHPLPDEQTALQYSLLCETMAQNGWDHYEVSNFAKPGGHARHNRSYWNGTPYLGIGPGAHTFDGRHRYAHPGNNPRYIRSLAHAQAAQDIPLEADLLSPTDRYNETLMTGFRTAQGISLAGLDAQWGIRPDRAERETWQRLCDSGHIIPTGTPDGYRIAEPHWLIGDSLAATFFETD
jgi:oxygen-independent coproporphyrinogen-3 oxidase